MTLFEEGFRAGIIIGMMSSALLTFFTMQIIRHSKWGKILD